MAGRRLLLVVALIAQAIALSACTRKIGSACRVSTDCSFRGERICDLSYLVDSSGNVDPQGKGECTIEGCSAGSCPKEGACIQTFNTEFLSIACDPEREDRRPPLEPACVTDDDCDDGVPCDQGTCRLVDDPSIYNRCTDQELCLPEGLCADISSARVACRKECKSDRNCRAGYECRETGYNGVYAVFDPRNPEVPGTWTVCMPIEAVPGEE